MLLLELLFETASVNSLAGRKYNYHSGFDIFYTCDGVQANILRRWQAIEIVIALSRNMSQFCDMYYVKVLASAYCGMIE